MGHVIKNNKRFPLAYSNIARNISRRVGDFFSLKE